MLREKRLFLRGLHGVLNGPPISAEIYRTPQHFGPKLIRQPHQCNLLRIAMVTPAANLFVYVY